MTRPPWLLACPAVMLSALTLAAPAQQPRNVDRDPAAGTPSATRRWAVVIGIDNYLDPDISDLRYAVADARLVADRLQAVAGYDPDHILLITDDQPADHLKPFGLNLKRQVPAWLRLPRPGDTLLVYFSGHGFQDDRQQLFLAPKDCEKATLALTGLRRNELEDWMQQCQASSKLLVLDACHAGSARGDGESSAPASAINAAFGQASGFLTLASCTGTQSSYEWDAQRHGLFTYFLAEGLSGKADSDRDGQVDSFELYTYTHDRVATTGQRELGRPQTPALLGQVVGRIILARVPSAPPLTTPAPPATPTASLSSPPASAASLVTPDTTLSTPPSDAPTAPREMTDAEMLTATPDRPPPADFARPTIPLPTPPASTPGTDPNLFVACFTVRQGGPGGPPAAGATIVLLYQAQDAPAPSTWQTFQVDSDGTANIAIETTETERTSGTFLVRITDASGTHQWPLPGFPAQTCWNLFVPKR